MASEAADQTSPGLVPSSAVASSSTSTSLPDPSLPAPELAEDEAGFTAADLIIQQARLEAQASEAIPFQFDTCTYEKGYIRQPVYACKTCGGGGVCAGCSVSCHSEHELVELFNKRKFRCDCGTPNLFKDTPPNQCQGKTTINEELQYPPGAKPCSLRKPGFDPQNDANRYNHNFMGSFCYCERGKTYDPEMEAETMFQCIVCEEWLHESCTSLIPTASPPAPLTTSSHPGKQAQAVSVQQEQNPPLIDHDLFDLMICDACVRREGNEILRRYAGSLGWMILAQTHDVEQISEWDGVKKIQVPTEGELTLLKEAYGGRSWQIFGLPLEAERSITETEVAAAADGALLSSVAAIARSSQSQPKLEDQTNQSAEVTHNQQADSPGQRVESTQDTKKRPLADAEDAEETTGSSKKAKVEETDPDGEAHVASAGANTCTLPRALPIVEQLPWSITEDWAPAFSKDDQAVENERHRYDIFLSEDFRSRICRCEACIPRWANLPHVMEAEETYAPPSDPQASVRDDDDAASITSSTYDLGMAALRSMPREKMINSLHAYSKFRDALWDHLRPFAGSGKAVTEEDVRSFFQKTLNQPDK